MKSGLCGTQLCIRSDTASYPDQITSLVGFEQENDAEQKKTVIIDANLIQKVTRPDKSDHWESKNVQTREEMQV